MIVAPARCRTSAPRVGRGGARLSGAAHGAARLLDRRSARAVSSRRTPSGRRRMAARAGRRSVPDLTRTRFDRAAERRHVYREHAGRDGAASRRGVHRRAVVRRSRTHLGGQRRRTDSRRRPTAARTGPTSRRRSFAQRPWSKISIMDASHFDALTAYAAVNTLRLDDHAPAHLSHARRRQDVDADHRTALLDGAMINVVREDPKTTRPAVRRIRDVRSGSRSTTATTGRRCA